MPGLASAPGERDTQPLTIGDRLSICLAWSEHDRHDRPGLVELGTGGFGNGQHPTTRLLLDELVDRLRGGERVLDVGCGSGVLGLGALRLGAGEVVAVDVKPEAVEAARRNAALNGMEDGLHATLAALGDLTGTFDVIVANVGRAAIVELAGDLTRLLALDGWLGVSGISRPSARRSVASCTRSPSSAVGPKATGRRSSSSGRRSEPQLRSVNRVACSGSWAARRSFFTIFPVADRGTASTCTYQRGRL